MKHYLIGSIFMFQLLSIISCSDDENKKNEDRVIGSWVAIMVETIECNDPALNISDDLVCTDEACTTLILNEDGTYEYTIKENLVGITEAGTWTLSGSTITFTFNDEDVETTYTRNFTISDELLILTSVTESTGCRESITFNPNESTEE